ncbi:MAG: hypothetical protein GXO27_01040 [Chlorobi bacterium]|nr:hypothetical protein [Chlorobiota bacterium]
MNDVPYISASLARKIGDKIHRLRPGYAAFFSRDLPPWRLHMHRTAKGVRIWNDSGAADPEAVWYAMMHAGRPLVWVVWTDRGEVFDSLAAHMMPLLKGVVVLGEGFRAVARRFGGAVPVRHAVSPFQALRMAAALAEGEGGILISPGTRRASGRDNAEMYALFERAIKKMKE